MKAILLLFCLMACHAADQAVLIVRGIEFIDKTTEDGQEMIVVRANTSSDRVFKGVRPGAILYFAGPEGEERPIGRVAQLKAEIERHDGQIKMVVSISERTTLTFTVDKDWHWQEKAPDK